MASLASRSVASSWALMCWPTWRRLGKVARAFRFLHVGRIVEGVFGADRTEIVDYWHVTEHVWSVARALLGEDLDAVGVWAEAWCVDLLVHGPEPWLAALGSAEPPDSKAAEALRRELGYFTTNAA